MTKSDRTKIIGRSSRAFHLGRYARWGILVLTAASVGAGCGNVTAGGLGETSVVLSGDAEGPGAGAAAAASWLPAALSGAPAQGGEGPVTAPALADGPLEGTVRVRLRVSLLSETGIPIDLTRGEREIEVDLAGEVEEEVVSVELQRGIYTRVRVVFTHVSAEVHGPFSEEGPTPRRVEVNLAEAGGEVVIEERVVLLVEGRARQEVLIDLRSPRWIAVDRAPPPALDVVAANVFRNAVRVSIR